MFMIPPVALLADARPILAGLAVLLLAAAACNDIAARIIPNWISLGVIVLGLLLRLGDGRLLPALVVALILFALLALCYSRGWLGGGDVKLFSASALLLPPILVPSEIVSVGIAGGILAVIYILLRRVVPRPGPRPRARLARILRAERFRIGRGGPLPYGVGIAIGCTVVLVRSLS